MVTFYICLMLMSICVHVFNRLPENSENRKRLKASILILITAANGLFVHGVSDSIPPFMASLMWGIVGATFMLGFYFYFLFVHSRKTSGNDEPANVGSLSLAVGI